MWKVDDRKALQCDLKERSHSVASSIVASVITVSRQHVAIDVSDAYDPKNPHSVMTLTISDMHTKHGTKWNGECTYGFSVSIAAISTIQLSNETTRGILQLSKTCSYSSPPPSRLIRRVRWKPTVFCFSRIPSSQRRIMQTKLRQLGSSSASL